MISEAILATRLKLTSFHVVDTVIAVGVCNSAVSGMLKGLRLDKVVHYALCLCNSAVHCHNVDDHQFMAFYIVSD